MVDILAQCERLYEISVKFYDNLQREPKDRRTNLVRIDKLFSDLEILGNKLSYLKKEINTDQDNTKLEEYFNLIGNSLEKSKVLILARREIADQGTTHINLDSDRNIGIMTEKFDIRVAASLLPSMDGTEEATKQLIDAIELYSEMLDDNGKLFLIKYILKVKINQTAKLRLDKEYGSVKNLLSDMNKHLIAKKSAAVLSTQLNSMKQGNKNIEDYAKSIEQLMLDLTISQADNDDKAISILKSVNEKIAINTFASGLRDSDLRTIVKARNYSNLKDAIIGAKEEEIVKNSSSTSGSNLFYSQGKRQQFNYTRRPFKRGHGVYRENGRFNKNSNFMNRQNQSNNNYNNRNQVQGRGSQTQRRHYRGNFSSRAYFANNENSYTNENKQFFRA